MGFQLNQVADARLRRRIQEALDAAYDLNTDLRRKIPNEADRQIHRPEPEQAVQDASDGKVQGTEEGPPRITVSIRSYRARLVDPDNLCPKSLIDGLRYAGIIPDDRPQDITLVVTQAKCDKKDERTEITISP